MFSFSSGLLSGDKADVSLDRTGSVEACVTVAGAPVESDSPEEMAEVSCVGCGTSDMTVVRSSKG